ncbi:MAG: hypothetical protein ACO1RT_06060, partial [Planctomycetaceae bacterium]
MKITEIEGISEYRLDNGVRVLLFPDDSKDVVTVNMTVFVSVRAKASIRRGCGSRAVSADAHIADTMFRFGQRGPSAPR